MSEEEAARLPSETGPVFGEEGYYAGNIEVFHQLHCLVRPPSSMLSTHLMHQIPRTDSEGCTTSPKRTI